MTSQEALNLLNDTEFAEKHQGKEEYTDMLLMCKEALEKQIPKKIGTEYITKELKRYYCPACNSHYYDISHKYCYYCGQALDWSDTK